MVKDKDYALQIESYVLTFCTVFRSVFTSDFSFSLVVLVWVYTLCTTLIFCLLNFIDNNYTIPEITFFVCCTFFSTCYIRLSIFKIPLILLLFYL